MRSVVWKASVPTLWILEHRFEPIVVGMGVAGEAVAGALAEAGLSVGCVDRKLLGGECPYGGCIPTKMMVRAADLLVEARRVNGDGRSRGGQL